nr:MAG TPA: hypothetical protein [Bacteriophage sp.]
MTTSKFDIERTIEVERLGKITASQGALNSIAIALYEASRLDYSRKCYATAELYKRQRDQIHEELEKHNFFQ